MVTVPEGKEKAIYTDAIDQEREVYISQYIHAQVGAEAIVVDINSGNVYRSDLSSLKIINVFDFERETQEAFLKANLEYQKLQMEAINRRDRKRGLFKVDDTTKYHLPEEASPFSDGRVEKFYSK